MILHFYVLNINKSFSFFVKHEKKFLILLVFIINKAVLLSLMHSFIFSFCGYYKCDSLNWCFDPEKAPLYYWNVFKAVSFLMKLILRVMYFLKRTCFRIYVSWCLPSSSCHMSTWENKSLVQELTCVTLISVLSLVETCDWYYF